MKKEDWLKGNMTISQQVDYAARVVQHGMAIKYKSIHYHGCADFLRNFSPHTLWLLEH
jgi:hypothetical protein